MALNKNKRIIWLVFAGFIILSAFLFLLFYNHKSEKLGKGLIEINDKIINIEIASTRAQWYQGLSDRQSLCPDCGMLFIFPDKQIRKFVMRNMDFPLDIVFINDKKIINIEKNLNPEGEDPENIYQSVSDSDMVLELNGKYTDLNDIKTGDKIILSDNN